METKLAKISEIAKDKPKERFTSLYHLLNREMLFQCHYELEADKASGVDEVTKEEYERNIVENIINLVERLKNHSYKPQPVKRIYIAKENGKQRPLGIPAYEDKIVQLGLKKILEAIYEPYFMDFSYGFRPKRKCHDALRELNRIIVKEKVNYIVDADIRSFFDKVDHGWLMEFVNHRIADPNIKGLLVKFLKAGIMEEGNLIESEQGTPQGAVISPVLANIYLHYVLDLWFEKIVKKELRGCTDMVRFADDFVCCFQYEHEAERFYKGLKQRLDKFRLEMAEEKSKIIMFGRFAERDRRLAGSGKPETFDFLGFTHYCGKSQNGKFRVKRKTSKKKLRQKIGAFKEWIKSVRNKCTIHEIFKIVRSKLIGHYRYYGITDNSPMINVFRRRVVALLFKWLNRRSQRRSFNFDQFEKFLKKNPLPTPRIYVSIFG